MSKVIDATTGNPHRHPSHFAPLSVWLRLLRESRGGPHPYWRKVMPMLLSSALTSPLRIGERLYYGRRVARTSIDKPPVFILGYWRSGTTFLHNLLVQDPNHGFVTMFQTVAPTFFFISQGWLKPKIAPRMAAKRPMDDVSISLDLPQEEEVAVANTTHMSFQHHLSFPTRAAEYFEKYVQMRGLTDREQATWDDVYTGIVRKATSNAGGRRIVLKSPNNLGRIPHLLRLFPNARFVHIMRDPYVLYASLIRFHHKIIPIFQLEDFSWDELEAHVQKNYVVLMQQYLQDRALIPKGQLTEVRYEELAQNPIPELQRIYADLALPDWEGAQKPIEDYVQTLSSYRKNRYQLDQAIVDRVTTAWGFAVQEWNYQPPNSG